MFSAHCVGLRSWFTHNQVLNGTEHPSSHQFPANCQWSSSVKFLINSAACQPHPAGACPVGGIKTLLRFLDDFLVVSLLKHFFHPPLPGVDLEVDGIPDSSVPDTKTMYSPQKAHGSLVQLLSLVHSLCEEPVPHPPSEG